MPTDSSRGEEPLHFYDDLPLRLEKPSKQEVEAFTLLAEEIKAFVGETRIEVILPSSEAIRRWAIEAVRRRQRGVELYSEINAVAETIIGIHSVSGPDERRVISALKARSSGQATEAMVEASFDFQLRFDLDGSLRGGEATPVPEAE